MGCYRYFQCSRYWVLHFVSQTDAYYAFVHTGCICTAKGILRSTDCSVPKVLTYRLCILCFDWQAYFSLACTALLRTVLGVTYCAWLKMKRCTARYCVC